MQDRNADGCLAANHMDAVCCLTVFNAVYGNKRQLSPWVSKEQSCKQKTHLIAKNSQHLEDQHHYYMSLSSVSQDVVTNWKQGES